MSDSDVVEHSYKILLLGDTAVGKTCFLKRYTEDTFQDAYLSTIGFDYKYKIVTLNNGKKVKVQLWDTAGQERFRTIAKSYYKGAQGIILMYDVTSQRTFDNIRKWLTQIKEEASIKVCVILIANKIDSEDRVISKEDGESLAESFKLPFFESSAKENINVDEAFKHLIEEISAKFENILRGSKLDNSGSKNNKKKCCK